MSDSYKNTRIYGFERHVLHQSFTDINVKVDEITVNYDEDEGHTALVELRSATCNPTQSCKLLFYHYLFAQGHRF